MEQTFKRDHAAGRLSLPAEKDIHLIPLPLVRQATNYTCGVGCCCSVLRYAGYELDVRQDELEKMLNANYEIGTSYQEIVNYLESVTIEDDNGSYKPFSCEVGQNRDIAFLEKTILEGKPSIICIQAWDYLDDYKDEWDSGHYVVANGFDEDNIYFMDPSLLGTYGYIPKDELDGRWHDMDGTEEFVVDHFAITVTIKRDYDVCDFYKIR